VRAANNGPGDVAEPGDDVTGGSAAGERARADALVLAPGLALSADVPGDALGPGGPLPHPAIMMAAAAVPSAATTVAQRAGRPPDTSLILDHQRRRTASDAGFGTPITEPLVISAGPAIGRQATGLPPTSVRAPPGGSTIRLWVRAWPALGRGTGQDGGVGVRVAGRALPGGAAPGWLAQWRCWAWSRVGAPPAGHPVGILPVTAPPARRRWRRASTAAAVWCSWWCRRAGIC
jgi:hypothetical protein